MIVVDANLLVALVSGDLRGGKVLQYFTDWLNHNIEIHAPLLAKYDSQCSDTSYRWRCISAGQS